MNDALTAARFWSKVEVSRSGVCWPWRAKSKHDHGYGVFQLPMHGGTVKAHRFAWLLTNGQIPEGQVVRHTCDNPPCCNPNHLELGSQADNVADMHERSRRTYKSSLDAEAVEKIRARSASGETIAAIAASLNLSASYISMLISGHRGNSITKGNTHVR